LPLRGLVGEGDEISILVKKTRDHCRVLEPSLLHVSGDPAAHRAQPDEPYHHAAPGHPFLREAAVLQKLAKEIAECYGLARGCRERAERALDPATKNDFLDQESRWLSLAHSYEFAERLSNFTMPFRRKK
jgi:hypothetical protein